MTRSQLEQLRQLLCHLQDSIRDGLIAARQKQAKNFAKVAAVTAADTIYQVDKISEHVIFDWFNAHWPRALPVELVMEGIEDEELVTFPRGTPVNKTVLKCIIDPID
ncbi:MAG TPA: inositol monophosphatase, partial [Opitutaceae bacterium]|nr:inositol monophosphatase [Opitutaceae bacterium]